MSLAGTGFRPAKRDGYKNRNSDTPLVGRGNNNLSHKPAPYLFHHQSCSVFGKKVRRLESWKVRRVSGYGPHPSPLLLGEGAFFPLPDGERELP
jgi:hypothetical protein